MHLLRCAARRAHRKGTTIELSIVVPTYNEAPNIAELVARITSALAGVLCEVVFVDDSIDATPEVVREVATRAGLPVRLIHRDHPTHGLGGAVVEGLAASRADVCVVMDADLQHPPEKIPELVERFSRGDVDLVVASRYAGGGKADGFADRTRVFVSKMSTLVAKAMFPMRLREVSDPMTGFFLVDRRALDLEGLKPRGFKILLEMLARLPVRVAEVPFDFGDRHAGESKASLRQGFHFIGQLTALRFGKMSLFALVGAFGAVVNVGIVWLLTALGVDYVIAAIIAAEATILGNFLLIERFVFHDMRSAASGVWARFGKSFGFNNAEALIRIPIMALMVESWHISSVVATAITLAVAFILRFVFHSLVVYAPKKEGGAESSGARENLEKIDEQLVEPGEL